jgi:hypothetical protein
VDVLRDELLSLYARDSAISVGGALVLPHHPPSFPGSARLHRVEFPGVVRDLGPLKFTRPSPPMPVGLTDGRLFFAFDHGPPTKQPSGFTFHNSTCWSTDLAGKNVRNELAAMPLCRAFHPSAHYGLVAWLNTFPGFALCEVNAR